MTELGQALAALFQSAGLVDELAHRRPVQESDLRCLLQGLFVFDAPDVASVFQPECLETGRQVARDCLQDANRLHLIGYVANLTALQARLASRKASSLELRQGLEHIQRQEGDLLHLDQLEALARLYTRHISPLSPRVMVQGKPQALRDARTVATIRSLLLAGVRAARLWVHTGGNRWHLVFRRGKLLREL